MFLLECVYSAWFLYTREDSGGKDRLFEVAVGVLFVLVLIFVVKRVARLVFSVIRNKYSRAKKKPIRLKQKSQQKFGDQAWQLVVHVSMTVYSLYVMRPEVDDGGSWWRNTLNCWVGPGGELGTAANTPLDRMYSMQLAIWIATAISHEYFDEKHKDYYVMYLHHIVTIFLVSFSWGINVKFGFLVLFVHDISDIGIDMIKLCNYCDYGLDDVRVNVIGACGVKLNDVYPPGLRELHPPFHAHTLWSVLDISAPASNLCQSRVAKLTECALYICCLARVCCLVSCFQLGLPVTEVVFVSALLGWIYYRLYEFPVRLINAAWYVWCLSN